VDQLVLQVVQRDVVDVNGAAQVASVGWPLLGWRTDVTHLGLPKLHSLFFWEYYNPKKTKYEVIIAHS
jgi:hypothetical protein